MTWLQVFGTLSGGVYRRSLEAWIAPPKPPQSYTSKNLAPILRGITSKAAIFLLSFILSFLFQAKARTTEAI